MPEIRNVAIIGGGISALAAGGLLSRHGLKVSIFEANDKIGGCCASTTIDGFNFNDGALYLGLPGILDYAFKKVGLERKSLLPLRKIKNLQAAELPNGTRVYFKGDGEVCVESASGRVDNGAVQNELFLLLKKWEPVLKLFTEDIMIHPFSLSHTIASGWKHLHKLRGNLAKELSRAFSDSAVISAAAGALLYSGMPPQKMPVSAILGLVAMLTEGFYLPEGGMGKIPEVLSQSMKSNGGEIFLNSKVKRIVVKNGRAVALELHGKGVVEADAVISTVSGMLTANSLLEPSILPGSMKRKAVKAPLSHKALTIQLGLSNRIDAPHHVNSILPFIDDMKDIFSPLDGEVKWLTYMVPTVTMPELAPEGGSIVETYPYINQDIPLEAWDEDKKSRLLEAAVGVLSKRHKMDISVVRTTSPKDYEKRLNLYKGALYGLMPLADPRVQFPYVTPIRGLYQAGQTTYPGYGVGQTAISGILAAETLLKTEKL